MARPALSEEERLNRRTALLEAAQQLYRERGYLPTVSDIARAAGMGKGTVYVWFRTKEEIFVALLDAGFQTLNTRLLNIIDALSPLPAAAAGDFAAHYVKLLAEIPDLLSLASMPVSIFKRNLPTESLSRFNRNLGTSLFAAGRHLERRIEGFQPGQGADLLFHTWTLTIGLWQLLELPEALREILDAPALSILQRRFDSELKAAVTHLWRGALSGGFNGERGIPV